MKVLVIGSGGREHALAWKLAQSPRVQEVLVAPGNAGTASEARCRNVDVRATDLDGLLNLAETEGVGLTVVGPEAPLVLGVVDRFRDAGQPIFGPTAAAAQLEGSKAYAKDFLARHGIPTAYYAVFEDAALALQHVRDHGAPIVIKADGLAAGKGVIIAQTEAEAFAAIEDMLAGNKFGSAGSRVVVEEFLVGEEASFIVMVDGQHALAFASSQDHKARDNADKGPNTGGMGAYSPAPVVTPAVHDWVMQNVIYPTVNGMASEGTLFTGFLYAGLMIGREGKLKVLEFNCRMGDPETQPIMMRLKTDLADLIEAAIAGRLDQTEAEWDRRFALGVVLAAAGYPENPRKGDPITGLPTVEQDDVHVFHAGTAAEDGQIVTAGGRVLCVVGLGDTVAEAKHKAYGGVAGISWHGEFHRHDIGWRAIAREQQG